MSIFGTGAFRAVKELNCSHYLAGVTVVIFVTIRENYMCKSRLLGPNTVLACLKRSL